MCAATHSGRPRRPLLLSVKICDAAQTPDEKEALAAIKEAYELGINFWDTAPFYGSGSAERVRPGCIAAVLDRVFAWYAACPGEYQCI